MNKAELTELERLLIGARISTPVSYYVRRAKIASLIAGVVGLVLGWFVFSLVSPKLAGSYIPTTPLPISLPRLNVATPHVLGQILTAVILGFVLYKVAWQLFLYYPKLVLDDRRRKIDRNLPHAVNYMYSLSKGGVDILDILKALVRNKNVYGEVAREFEYAMIQIEHLGKDFKTAMLDLYEITPSSMLREFISGLITTIDSGGDITSFLASKSEQFAEKTKIEQKRLLETLGILAESYVTVGVAFTLLMIILSLVTAFVGMGSLDEVYTTIYMVIPVTSLFIAGLVHMLMPKESKIKIEEKKEDDAKKVYVTSELVDELKKSVKKAEMTDLLKNPFKAFCEEPLLAVVLSVPIGLASYSILAGKIRADIAMTLSVIFALLPLVFFYEKRAKFVRIMNAQLPEVLKGLASVTTTGATLQRAIETVASSGKGYLYDELKQVVKNVEWNINLAEALKGVIYRTKIPSIARTFTIISDVLTLGGDITEALYTCGKDVDLEKTLRIERKMNMTVYLIVIYIGFFTFVGIMFMLMHNLFSVFLHFTSNVKTKLGALQISLTKDQVIWVFSQATVIEAIFSGLVVGALGEGDLLSGLKHVLIMLAIVVIVLTLI